MKRVLTLLLTLIITSANVLAGDGMGMRGSMTRYRNNMNNIMDSWVGENINTVIRDWGYPTRERFLLDKRYIYWDEVRFYPCTMMFIIDQSNTIESWKWSGNGCSTAIGYTYKKMGNPRVPNQYERKSKLQQKTIEVREYYKNNPD